jgi:hypothetical protein
MKDLMDIESHQIYVFVINKDRKFIQEREDKAIRERLSCIKAKKVYIYLLSVYKE